MGSGIALLLSGEPDDLPACICAVQLAARSESKLYALQDCLAVRPDRISGEGNAGSIRGDSRYINSFSFVVEFAGNEGVQVSCHLLEGEGIEQLVEFITIHSITCLVLNKEDKFHESRQAKLTELQRRLGAGPRQYSPHLQVITAPLWEEMDLKQVVRQFRRLDRLGPVKFK